MTSRLQNCHSHCTEVRGVAWSLGLGKCLFEWLPWSRAHFNNFIRKKGKEKRVGRTQQSKEREGAFPGLGGQRPNSRRLMPTNDQRESGCLQVQLLWEMATFMLRESIWTPPVLLRDSSWFLGNKSSTSIPPYAKVQCESASSLRFLCITVCNPKAISHSICWGEQDRERNTEQPNQQTVETKPGISSLKDWSFIEHRQSFESPKWVFSGLKGHRNTY